MKTEYTKSEIRAEIETLENTFDVVRIVDPILCEEYALRRENDEYAPDGCFCFQVWNKNERCKNCISAIALSEQTRVSKFEYCGNILNYVVARYVVVEGNKYVLETVSKLDRSYTDVFFNNDDRTKKILDLYKEVRIDVLTGLYNRRFLVEKLQQLMIRARTKKNCHPAVAYINISGLSQTNETYGHLAGDAMIKAIAETMIKSVNKNDENDFISRLTGGDFIICFSDSSVYKLKKVIDKLTVEVSRTNVKNYPQLKPSINAGIADFTEAKTYDEIVMLADKRSRRASHVSI